MDICQLNTTLTSGRGRGRMTLPLCAPPHTALVIFSFISLFSGLNLSEEKLDFSSNKWWVRARGVLWLCLCLADMVWLMSSAQHSFWANINIMIMTDYWTFQFITHISIHYEILLPKIHDINVVIDFILWFFSTAIQFWSTSIYFNSFLLICIVSHSRIKIDLALVFIRQSYEDNKDFLTAFVCSKPGPIIFCGLRKEQVPEPRSRRFVQRESPAPCVRKWLSMCG